MTTCLRVAVVDDEPPARRGLVRLLKSDPDLKVVGEFADGASALESISSSRPDIVILDVQMPEINGFELLELLPEDYHPAVVFVTAHDSFALHAFDVSAVDYVLKPFDDRRFFAALARAKQTCAQHAGAHRDELLRLRAWLARSRADKEVAEPSIERIVIRDVAKSTVINVGDLLWIEGAGYYVRLHVPGRSHLLRETMSALEARLPAREFFRVHRSAIVRLSQVREIRPLTHGDSVAILSDGARVRVARGRRLQLEAAIERGAGP